MRASAEFAPLLKRLKLVKAIIVGDSGKAFLESKPFIIGENLNRYRILKHLYIDTSRTKRLPKCPYCSAYDSAWPQIGIASSWHCSHCGKTFGKADIDDAVSLGINYKESRFYSPPKLLVRKTGRGIYATVDETDAMTNQVVFIFRLKPDLQGNDAHYSIYYVLGVLNSKTVLYEYYKRTADIEWKSFPYLTQKTIMQLPIPSIDFGNAKERTLHDGIAEVAARAVTEGGASEQDDEAIESMVMELFQLSGAERAHIRTELAEVARYGSLLGSHDGLETEETESGTETPVWQALLNPEEHDAG